MHRQDKPQPLWDAVAAFRPDVLLMLGDNIYGDTEDMDVLREKYAQLAAQPGFAALRQRVPIVAVWDDHDYGADDAGREYPRKRESQQVFCDFFGVAADSPLRAQAGIYRGVTVGPPGRRVQFICLDTRYHRSPLNVIPQAEQVPGQGPYRPSVDPDATVLGAEQWAWLERASASRRKCGSCSRASRWRRTITSASGGATFPPSGPGCCGRSGQRGPRA